jgi:adenylosuccinate synthase
MANVVVLGAQWGDEGKAKIIDMLADNANMVVRCQGGCNAGHTVQCGKDVFKFHLVPSGMLYGGKHCLIGNGTVIHPDVLLGEIDTLQAKGYDTSLLKLSDRAHLTLPFHIELDKAAETAACQKKIGTTGRGIGPTYIDKVGRYGLRVGDLYEPETVLRERLLQIVEAKAPLLSLCPVGSKYSAESLLSWCQTYADRLRPYVADTVSLLHEALERGESILFEGAQGTLLDIDYGTYPYVTSSNATAGGVCTGSGIGPTRLDHVLGVMKAYTTRVGEGPFPTELNDAIGRRLLEMGQEFGTTTGRPRRCGWFDAMIARYGVRVNGLDSLAITKLDVLSGIDELKICIAYRNPETGELLKDFPAQTSLLKRLEPVYETWPGWREDCSGSQHYEDLPLAARRYLARIEELAGCPISIVSVGPDRVQTIMLQNPMTQPNRRAQPCLKA